MATVNKDFRVKHGLVVEGSTATVNGSNVLTEASTEFLQDTTAAMLTGGSQSGITFTYNDSTGVIDAAVSSTPTFDDKITFEGLTADSFETVLQVTEPSQDNTITLPNASGTVALTSDIPTTENIEDIVGGMVSSNVETGISVTYDDAGGKLDFAVSDEYVQDVIGGMVTGNSETGITVTYDDVNGKLDFSVATLDTEAVQDIVGAMVSTNTENGISVTYDDLNGKLDFDVNDPTITLSGDVTGSATMTNLGNVTITATIAADSVALGTDTTGNYVAGISAGTGISVSGSGSENATVTVTNDGVLSVSGTTNQIAASTTSGAVTLSLPSAVTFPGTVTLNADPQNPLEAATKQYVDAATAGLNVHDSVKAATTTNINLSTDLENGDLLDGVTLATGNRVLVKNQTTKSQNGVYVVQVSGAAVRAADYNESGEVDAGDFIFVEAGTANGKTGWVQTNTITTIGSDDIEFTQFSGAGTYLAGNGLTLTGEVFSINTAITADLSSTQTLTNKTLTSPTITSPTVSGLYLSDNNIVIEGNPDTFETTLTFTNPTADRTITFKDETGTVAYTADITSAINALSTTDIEEGTNLYYTAERVQDEINDTLTAGSGISLTYTDNGASDGTLQIANTGVLSIAGTTDQISASSSTGAITLSLPQNIATTSSPTFAGLTVGSLTLTDALIGTATQALTDGSATVVDTWAAASYNSAKYVVQMKKGTDIEVIEVLVTIDGNNNVYLTEYADVISNTQLGTTDADYSSGNVRLLVTASNGTTVKVHKTLIEA